MNAATPLLNPSDLTNEQLDRIAFAIAGRIQKGDELMTKDEAAAFLKIKYKTFERRLSRGHYPASIEHWDGGTLLFIKSEILKYVASL
jgi:hypothetical protein